ncbi:hypothetical protein MLD38_014125 [Melastoma candidum]|uniref:Uncharacterized protein n=1 Tax=Melastoma candidum TaxID=119954 RepID=A0ACB9REV8_9MYRT|nr:hypothetical protein MLD38_014125 [Melastoma candidum]
MSPVISLSDEIMTWFAAVVETMGSWSWNRWTLITAFFCIDLLTYLGLPMNPLEKEMNGIWFSNVVQKQPFKFNPSILVSDILWQSNEPETTETAHQLLRRTDAPTVLITNVPSYQHSYEERKATYLAARERIFADDIEMNETSRQRPEHVPVVAWRMIAHALGKKADTLMATGKAKGDCRQSDVHEAVECCPDSDYAEGAKDEMTLCQGRTLPRESIEEKLANIQVSQKGRRTNGIDSENSKKEHMGAAKRMFAQALGRPTAKPGRPLNEGGSR